MKTILSNKTTNFYLNFIFTVCAVFFVNVGFGQLFQQQFATALANTSNTTLTTGTYCNSAPSNAQFTGMNSTGAGSVFSVAGNKLTIAKTGNAWGFARGFAFSGPPTSLMVRFDYSNSATSGASTSAVVFGVGGGTTMGTANSSITNADNHSRISFNTTANANEFIVRDIAGSSNGATTFSGTQTVLFVINNSGSGLTYKAPDGTYETVANDKFDVWIGTSKQLDEKAATSATQTLSYFKCITGSTTNTVNFSNMLIDPIQITPTSSAATSVSSTGFVANWTAVTGATGYRLDVSTASDFSSFVAGYNNLYVSGQATATKIISGLSANTTYYYRVRAVGQYTVDEFASGNSSVQNTTTLSSALTVTYDSQGGSAISSGSTTTGGTIASSPGTPTRAGYTFNGWFAASSGGSAITFPYTHGQTANFTLYAQWTLITYTVSFNANNGTGSMSNQTAAVATNLTANAFTRSGYSFSGWNTATDGSGTSYANSASFPFTANATLFAQWTVVSTPTISTTGSLSALSSTYGTSSSNTTFSVSGSALTNNILITPPAGFEVSISSGSGFGPSITLIQSGGVVSATTIYVRLAATTNIGSYSGNIVLSSTSASNVNVATVSSTVNPATLTVTGLSASGKTYDGNTTVSVSGTAAFSGLQNGDSFTPSGSLTWAFPSANVGLQTLTRTGSILAPNSNYTVTQPSLTATISAKALTISSTTGNSKAYDGTQVATFTGTLTGIVSPDVVTFTGSGTFATSGAGTGIAITSTATLVGVGAGNYTLTQPTGITANITQASQTITFGALADRIVGGATFGLTATANSGLTVTYTSSNTSVVTVSGSTVTIVGAGTTVITASQSGNTNYAPASNVTQNQVVVVGPCGTESFTNSNATASYSDNSFTGDNGVTWTYTQSSNDATYQITATGLLLRRSSSNSKVVSGSVSGGIGNFTCKLLKGFTGAGSRQVALYVNNIFQANSTAWDNTSVQTFTVNNINITGNVVIEIRNITSNQVVVDDISWTCYSAPEINIKQSSTNLASGSGSYSFGNVTMGGSSSAVTFTVENIGTEMLNLTGTPKIAISGQTSDFAINQSSASATIAATGSTSFTVTFSPTTTGVSSATISIANDDSNENPYTFTVTGTGATYAPSVITSAATLISTTGGTLNGDVTSDGGATVTERGFVYKTSSSVTILDNKTIVAGTTGTFSLSISSFSASTQYYFRAYAINLVNTTLGSELNFWTLANTPSAPTVNTPTSSSLSVSIGGSDGNSATTAYAIQETTSGNYVQANGSLGASAVWQTASSWSAIAVIGLSSATTYTFKLKARNGDNVETASFSATTSGTTSSIGLNAVILTSALTSTYGSVSSGVSFTASGTNLTGNITATAQSGYEVSTDDLTYGSSVSVASGTTVYVRFTSTLLVGSYNNQVAIILSGGGASSNSNVTTSLAGNTVSQKALTVTGFTAQNKTYDGLTTATFTGTLTGVVSPDVVTFTGSGTFASVNVGTAIAITSTAALGGVGAANYTLTQPTGITANITAKSLTITANNVTKEIGATLTGGTGSSDFTSSGLVGSQTIGSVTLTYGTGAAAGDAVGSYSNQVTPSAATGGTFLASNYSISYVAGNITVQNTTAVVISSLCSPFTQNFNTLASSGTSSTTATGWYFNESGSNANVIYSAGTGSDNAGDSYSFGSASNSDRSFGGLRSGSLIPTIGAKFLNNTGSTINALTLSYSGETWRVGVASRSDRLDFQYSTNATSLTTGTWTDVDNLDYANPGQGATGSASLQHSASISSGISSLSIANGATFWIRWSDFDATGADDGMGVDDFSITACQCASPDALAFVQQPTNVSQGVAMAPSVTVKAICSSSGGTANSYTGNITLTASGGGCGYVSQTVTAVNGIATFDNIVFTRSTQTGITLTASASALTNAVSSTFNVTSGGGISTSTDIRNDNFSGSTPAWTWTSSAVSVGSGGTSGSDVTGVITAGSNTYLRKSYSANNTSSEKGTKSTITFANTTSLSSYNTLKFTFKIASLNSSGNVTACNGCGVDGPDSLFIETSVNGGTSWQRILTHVGASDKLFVFGGSVLSLTYGTNTILGASSTQSAFSVSIPSGTSQFQFRMIARNNRTGENWCIDDVKLVGESYSGAVTSPLPTVSAFGATNICAGGSAYLYSSLSNAVGVLTYNWAPATGLSATNTSDVTATLNGTQTYIVTVTDGDNCIASSSAVTVTVDSPGTPAGDWLGTYSNDWFDCRNWKGKEVPSTTTDVTILSGTAYSPVIYQAGANCRALTIQNSAILTVNDPSSALDVYGAYTNNGALSHTNGDITLTGTAAYNADCGTSSPFYNLKINNSSSEGINLVNSDMVISNQLSLADGVITSNNNKVIMTSSNAADLLHSSGNASFIFGNLRRFIASNTSVYELPVGLSSETFGYRRADFINNNIIGVNYIDASVRAITETGNNIDSRLATSQIGSSLTDVIGSSIWSLVPNVPPSSGKYGVNLYVANLGLSALDDNTFCPVKRNDNSTDYADWSTFEQSTTIPMAGSQGRIYDAGNGYAQRLGYSSFSEHAFGKTPSMQPLPVQLTLFKTSCNEKSDALINWTTATETNSDYFQVEVSTDLVSWSEIAQVNAAGNSSSKREYVITDNLSRDLRYYRLVQVDFDGKQRIYDPISLNCGGSESVFLIYPNPTSGDFVVSIQNEKLSGEIAVTLNTADGKLISTKTSEAKAGMQSIYFENNQLPAGIYFVNVIDQFGNQLSGKIVVR